jgi:transcriptional regulator with XRE-family HTH domain
MTQEDLCEAANIDRSYLQRIESGTMNPSFDVLRRLVKALKVSWLDILFKIDDMPQTTEQFIEEVRRANQARGVAFLPKGKPKEEPKKRKP